MSDVSTVRHPDYVEEAVYQATAWDVYRGGRNVIVPSQQIYNASFMQADSNASGQSEEREAVHRAIYRRSAISSYLHSHVREQTDEYSDRVARAVHIPVFRSIVDVYVAAVLRTDAERSGGDAFWANYWSNIDMAGTQVDTFFRQALTYALVYKKAFAVTDRVGGFAAPAQSKGAQMARGERAYSYLIPPTDLVDWSLDKYGQMLYGVVREDSPDSREPGEKHADRKSQYRVWHRDRWELWRKSGRSWKVDEAGLYPSTLREVPIAPIYARRGHESRRTMGADGILSDVLDMDLNIFNLLSLFHDQVYSQCFNQLVMPSDGQVGAGDMELGTKRALLFDSESQPPHYIAPNSAILLALWQIIMDEISITRQMASTSRGRAEYSKEERSAAALQAESGDKSNAVSSLVGCVEEFDRTVHRHAAAWEGIDPSRVPSASYSRDVSLKALSAQIDDAIKLSTLQVPREAMTEVYKPLVARMLREHGQGEDAIQRAQAAIEKLKDGMEQAAEVTLGD